MGGLEEKIRLELHWKDAEVTAKLLQLAITRCEEMVEFAHINLPKERQTDYLRASQEALVSYREVVKVIYDVLDASPYRSRVGGWHNSES